MRVINLFKNLFLNYKKKKSTKDKSNRKLKSDFWRKILERLANRNDIINGSIDLEYLISKTSYI